MNRRKKNFIWKNSLLVVRLFTVTGFCFDGGGMPVIVFVEETKHHYVLTESRKQIKNLKHISEMSLLPTH